MGKEVDQNKIVKLAVNQNLLLWQLSKSFLDIEKKLFLPQKHHPTI